MNALKKYMAVFFLLFAVSCASSRKTSPQKEVLGPLPPPSQEEVKKEEAPPAEISGPPEPVGPVKWLVVASPGLARSFALVGVFKEMEKLKIPVSGVIATELGALWSVLYASSKNSNEFLWKLQRIDPDLLQGFQENLTNKPSNSWTEQLRRRRLDKKWEDLLTTLFGNKVLESLRITVYVGIRDKNSESYFFLNRGLIRDRLRCALAREGLLSPCNQQGSEWISSDTIQPMPVEFAKSISMGHVLAVDLLTPPVEASPSINEYEQVRRKTTELSALADKVLTPSLDKVRVTDFSQRNQAEFKGKLEVDRLKSELKP